LTVVFGIAPIRTFAMTSPENYWAVGIVCVCVLLLSASLAYVLIERPGIALGKRFVQRTNLPRASQGTPRVSNT